MKKIIVVTVLMILSTNSSIADTVTTDTVKVTPLGSQEGEFCQFDRALIFEDSNGTRLLYDPGRTVAGAEDERLGKIDIILISHMHDDVLGDKHISAVGGNECTETQLSISSSPNTNVVNIALAKNSKIISGGEMPRFFSKKLKVLGGDPTNSQLVGFGASRNISGITISTVPSDHSNGISSHFIGGQLGDLLNEAGLTAYAGPPTGFVLRFSNDLVVYLSGDSGITTEQKTLVRKVYKAKLAVIAINDTATTGPEEAARIVNNSVKPTAVIPSQANQASTKGGKVLSGTRLDIFQQLSKKPVYIPLSGVTMSFDSKGKCIQGCST